MNLLKIIQIIERHRGYPPRAYTSFCIGSTSIPDKVRERWEPWHEGEEFLCLEADSKADADAIVDHFRQLGMWNDQSREPSGPHVFIYCKLQRLRSVDLR